MKKRFAMVGVVALFPGILHAGAAYSNDDGFAATGPLVETATPAGPQPAGFGVFPDEGGNRSYAQLDTETRDEDAEEALYQDAVRMALAAIRFVLDDDERDRGLAVIAKGVAEVGRPAEAVDIAHEIESPAIRGDALRHIVDMFLDDEDIDAALTTAWKIEDPASRSIALRNVAEFQARQDDIDSAMETAGSIEVIAARAIAFSDIAELAADRDRVDQARTLISDALELAETVTTPAAKADSLNEIGRAQIFTHGIDAATETFNRAIQVAQSLENRAERERVLYLIAKNRSQSPDVAGSLENARTLSDPVGLALLWREIGKEYGEADRIDQANEAFESSLAAALRIEEPTARSRLLGKVAEAMAERAGNLERALSVADLAPDAAGRDLVLLMLVGNLGETKDNRTAMEVARMVTGESEKLVALVDIAKTSAELGDQACASEILEKITEADVRELDGGFQTLVFRELAEAHTKVGDAPRAFQMADRIGPPMDRATAFSAIAEILMQKRRGPPHSWPWPRSGRPASAELDSAC